MPYDEFIAKIAFPSSSTWVPLASWWSDAEWLKVLLQKLNNSHGRELQLVDTVLMASHKISPH